MNQLMHLSVLFTAWGAGSVVRQQGRKNNELGSERLCFANHLARDDSTPRQACA